MQPGARIGEYEVVRELGRGGMGVVLEVRRPDLPDRRLALKLILGADPASLLRFTREAEVLARVRHPGVVAVHELARTAQGPAIITDLVEGRGLDALAGDARPGVLEPRRAARLVRDLADAVAAVHAHGVLHRDLKPANVIVRDDDAPVLIDFGLAHDPRAERLTATGALLGTPAYMAPEQVVGARGDQGPATDVYGLGAILFELLAGRPPHEGASAFEVASRVARDEPRWPSRDRPVPAELEAICRRAMARDPANRHPSAAALRDDLIAHLSGGGRSRGRPSAVAASLLAVALAAALLAARPDASDAPTPRPATAPTAPTAPTPMSATSATPERPREADWIDAAADAPFPEAPRARLDHVRGLREGAGWRPGDRERRVQARFLPDGRIVTWGTAAPALTCRVWSLGLEAGPPLTVLAQDEMARLAVLPGAGSALVCARLALAEAPLDGATVTMWFQPAMSAELHALAVLSAEEVLVGQQVMGASLADPRRTVPLQATLLRVSRGRAEPLTIQGLRPVSGMDVRGGVVALATGLWPRHGTDVLGGELLVLDRADLEAPPRRLATKLLARRVALSPDGARAAVALSAGLVLLVDLSGPTLSAVELHAPELQGGIGFVSLGDLAHGAPASGLAFSPDGRRLWTVCGEGNGPPRLDGELRLWDVAGPDPRHVADMARPRGGAGSPASPGLEPAVSLDVSPDGRLLVVGTVAGEAQVWVIPRALR